MGNILAIPIGFAEITRLKWVSLDGKSLLWTPMPPENRKNKKGEFIVEEIVPITNRWIYAFETGYKDNGKIAILAREYWADQHGALSFVDGAKRRLVEFSAAPRLIPVPDSGLPLKRQQDLLHYVCIGTRGRLSKDAIWDIEGKLTGDPAGWWMDKSIYKPQYPGDRPSLAHDPNSQTYYLNVIDPLTLAEYLSEAYNRALNEFYTYWTPNKDLTDEKNKEIATRAAKYQLAQIIKENLLLPDNRMDVKSHLRDEGRSVTHFMAECEAAAQKLEKQVQLQIAALILFHESGTWAQARSWYLGKKPGPKTPEAKTIGHFFLETESTLYDRMGETQRGRDYLHKRMKDPDGPLSWLLVPEKPHKPGREEAYKKALELYKDWLPVVEKAITGVAVGIAEFGPALSVYRQLKRASHRVTETLQGFFEAAAIEVVEFTPTGHITRNMFLAERVSVVRLNQKQAAVDLEKWIERGRPKWPDGHRWATPSAVLNRLVAGLTILNLHSTLDEMVKDLTTQGEAEGKFKTYMKMVGAVLDVVVATEDPIREWARGMASVGTKEAGAHAAAGIEASVVGKVATSSVEEEAGIVAKLTRPAAFKMLGAASAALDAYVNYAEMLEAGREGDRDVALGHKIEVVGSFATGIGSVLAALSYTEAASITAAAAAMTAASLCLIVVGIAASFLGTFIVAYCKTSPWQKFARHCVFGCEPQGDGETTWSGSNFSEWTDDPKALALQIRVLTAMLLSFKVHGTGAFGDVAASQVQLSFGVIPPHAELQIQFALTFADGHTANPGYAVDLNKKRIVRCWNGASLEGQALFRTDDDGKLSTLDIGPEMPKTGRIGLEKLDTVRIVRSSCSVMIKYGKGAKSDGADVATGTIPIRGALTYQILDDRGLGSAHIREIDSLGEETSN